MVYFLAILLIITIGLLIWQNISWRKSKHSFTQTHTNDNSPAVTAVKERQIIKIPSDLDNLINNSEGNSQIISYHEHSGAYASGGQDNEFTELKNILEEIQRMNQKNKDILFHTRVADGHLNIQLTYHPAMNENNLDPITSLFDITYNSRVDGSRIYFKFPIGKLQRPDDISVARVEQVKEKFSFSRSLDTDDQIILIVEDNHEVAKFIESCIPISFKTVITPDGEVGLQLAQEIIPDLVISDIMMPKKDGLELCQSLKTDFRTEHIPVILLTAKATDRDRLEGLQSGADAYINKPFDENELVIRIENLLRFRDNIKKSSHGVADHDKNSFSKQLYDILEQNYNQENFGVRELAKALHMSRMQAHRKIKSSLQLTTSEAINEFRLEKGYQLLSDKSLLISEVAYNVGFSDSGYFAKLFKVKYGVSPSQFRMDN